METNAKLTAISFVSTTDGGIAVLTRKNRDEEGPGLTWTPEIEASPIFLLQENQALGGLMMKVSLEGEIGTKKQLRVSCVDLSINSESKEIALGDDGKIENLEVLLPIEGVFDQGIQVRNVSLVWEVSEIGQANEKEKWETIATTTHRLYLGLAMPGAPWSETVDKRTTPWTDALEWACTWAQGCTEINEVATSITENLMNCGLFVYDTANGATNYTLSSGYFQLTDFLARLGGSDAWGDKINCTDCATIISTFANLLGCNMQQVRLESNFDVRAIRAIGTDYWASPFDGQFYYHEVAWEGEVSTDGRIYDACLHLDENKGAEGTEPQPFLSLNLRFGESEPKLYRQMLTPDTDTGAAICFPNTSTSIIRKLD